MRAPSGSRPAGEGCFKRNTSSRHSRVMNADWNSWVDFAKTRREAKDADTTIMLALVQRGASAGEAEAVVRSLGGGFQLSADDAAALLRNEARAGASCWGFCRSSEESCCWRSLVHAPSWVVKGRSWPAGSLPSDCSRWGRTSAPVEVLRRPARDRV